MMRACAFAIACTLVWLSHSMAHGQSRVDASLDKLDVGLGEPFTLTASVDHAVGTTVEWPTALKLGPGIEALRREVFPPEQTGERVLSRAAFAVVVFERNTKLVPTFDVTLRSPVGREVLATPSLAIAIRSTVTKESATLRSSRAPLEAPVRNWNLLLGLLAACACVALIVFVVWAKRQRGNRVATVSAVSVASPHEEALRALDAMEASGRLDSEELKTVFHEMSEIMRAYLGRRFEFPALDQTSSEIRSRLKSCEGSHEWGPAVNTWLGRCDLVKYAGAEVDADEARTALYSARVLVERTKEDAVAQDRPTEVARA